MNRYESHFATPKNQSRMNKENDPSTWLTAFEKEYAEIGEIRRIEINYEAISPTLNNVTRWVAAVRQTQDGRWGGIIIDPWHKPHGELILKFVCENQESVFKKITE